MILKSSTTGSAHLLWVQPRKERDDPEIAWVIARIGNPQLNPPCPSSSSGSFSESSMSEPSVSEPSSSESSGGGSGGSSGSGGGSGGSSGGGGGGGNCFLYGTLVRLADGRLIPIERLQPGDEVASLDVPGLDRDADWQAQYQWRVTGAAAPRPSASRIASVSRGTHEGFFLINGRVKATFEHPFLIRRGDETGFCSAELLRVGDRLVRHDLDDEAIESIRRIDRTVRTVALHVPRTNVYLADGVWVHNDALSSGSGGSGSSSGGAGSSSKSSGSSFGGPGSSSSGSSGSGITVPF
ncbi:MAG: Hint domain-containing protein [Phycisphaerales bacterium JB054]